MGYGLVCQVRFNSFSENKATLLSVISITENILNHEQTNHHTCRTDPHWDNRL
jgi:hypothetical protein